MKHTPDFQLLSELHAAVQSERKLTLRVIELLEQVERKKLYLILGFGSLLEFCMKDLGYSESAAYRRISAMRAVQDVPEIKTKIADGTLSLAVVAQAQTHIRQSEKLEKMQIFEKKALFESLEGKSIREAEKELIARNPEVSLKKESIRQVTVDFQELRITLSPDMQKDIEKLKELLSHSMPGASITEILQFAVKESIQKRDLQKQTRGEKSQHKATPAPVSAVQEKLKTSLRIQLPVSVKREVWRKAQGQCCYRHQGRRCESRFQLEIDHKIPLSKGGLNTSENLQLLCRAHNTLKGMG